MTEPVRPRRAVAFYLPQFHPIPENDEWWGPGFTEWTNVARAVPQFRGHDQPRHPGSLGYYDLRDPEVREAQAAMAQAAGVYGFCYYHYWFGGRRLLELPEEQLLATRKPTFPFMLCWANESWSRRWDGTTGEILMEQSYDLDDDARHIDALLPFLQDDRYIRVQGKPVLLVYRVDELPEPERTADTWRRRAAARGVDLYLCCVQSSRSLNVDPTRCGFDAAVQFVPQTRHLGRALGWRDLRGRAMRRVRSGSPYTRHRIYDYDDLIRSASGTTPAGYVRYPCVAPGWDNTARRPVGARIVRGSTPEKYEAWLRQAISRPVPEASDDEDLVFINAWNEWAEGAYLEPDTRWGDAYLRATRSALDSFPSA
jgi:lipopolysaccharide biosynthesis protein